MYSPYSNNVTIPLCVKNYDFFFFFPQWSILHMEDIFYANKISYLRGLFHPACLEAFHCQIFSLFCCGFFFPSNFSSHVQLWPKAACLRIVYQQGTHIWGSDHSGACRPWGRPGRWATWSPGGASQSHPWRTGCSGCSDPSQDGRSIQTQGPGTEGICC